MHNCNKIGEHKIRADYGAFVVVAATGSIGAQVIVPYVSSFECVRLCEAAVLGQQRRKV